MKHMFKGLAVLLLGLSQSIPCRLEAVPPDAFDPHPLPDDLVLPMPNQARMVFRPVYLGLGHDPAGVMQFNIGDRAGEQATEKLVPVELGGSFTAKVDGKEDWLFYLGKYEVTQSQYRAVVGGSTPTGTLPATNLPRLSVESFLQAYNQWLQKSAPGTLPTNDAGSRGYLRLPNEEEWEFAARGGRAVSQQQFEARTPYVGLLERYEWTSTGSFNKLKSVGLLEPNALNLYDMLGNASEMTGTPYQIEHGRGKEGGYVVRGGSFRNTAAELRASQRTAQDDINFNDNLPAQDDACGFRLVIASPVIPGHFSHSPLPPTNTPTPAPTASPPPLVVVPPPTAPPSSQLPNPTPGSVTKPPAVNTPAPVVALLTTPSTQGFGGSLLMRRDAKPPLVEPKLGQGFVNDLGMKFIPVPGTKVLFSVYQTRRREYFAFAGRTFDDPEVYKGLHLGGDDTHPMISVSQVQALAFCKWLEARDQNQGLHVKYRLPTSAEWTAACGGHRFPWGDLFPPNTVVGNYGDLALSARIKTFTTFGNYLDKYVTTAPVGRFPANAFGLFDLGSNVQEWTMDKDAQDYAVVRGASWRSFREEDLQVLAQLSLPSTTGLPFVGFRCVIEP